MSDKIKDIQKRKEELEQDIQELQEELDRSIQDARTDLSNRLKPKNLIREYPLSSLGVSLIAGLLLGKGINSPNDQVRTETRTSSETSSSSQSKDGIGKDVWSEIKHSVTKRAVRLLLKYLEDVIVASRKERE